MTGEAKIIFKGEEVDMDALALTHAASKINRRMPYMAYDAELNLEAAHIVSEWFRLAQRWALSNERPALRNSLRQVHDRITPVTYECCGRRTTKSEALCMRYGEEIYLCPTCQNERQS